VSDKLQKKVPDSLKENTQYALAFGLIATMLLVAGFPVFVIFFFAIFAYFLWKTFSQPSRGETDEIFKFYHSANELLRDDERRWFGFEVQEVIVRGERILQLMNGAPPLVYFTLGALYHKMGDHKSAVNHLAYVIENENAEESAYIYPSPDLRNYVKLLRKIEREPAGAPETSAAIRALERARRNRGKSFLDASRVKLIESNEKKQKLMGEEKKQIQKLAEINADSNAAQNSTKNNGEKSGQNGRPLFEVGGWQNSENEIKSKQDEGKTSAKNDVFANRQPISEVLRDIYDNK
jgi:flagellar biogenesis protein FliO